MSDGAVVVRDARAEEREAIRALTWTAYGEFATTMAPAAWAGLAGAVHAALDAADAERIVAVRGDAAADGALLGSVLLFPAASDAYGGLAAPPPLPELRLLAVAPAARGLGVGEALVRECARRARAAGAAALGLHTSASMRAAQRLYARLGFVRDPATDFQPDGAEVVEGFRLALGPEG